MIAVLRQPRSLLNEALFLLLLLLLLLFLLGAVAHNRRERNEKQRLRLVIGKIVVVAKERSVVRLQVRNRMGFILAVKSLIVIES